MAFFLFENNIQIIIREEMMNLAERSAIILSVYVILEIKILISHVFRQYLYSNQRYLRDHSDPFNLPEPRFVKLFRVDKVTALEICNSLSNHVADGTRSTFIPKHLKVIEN